MSPSQQHAATTDDQRPASSVGSALSFAEAQLWQAHQTGGHALPFFDCAPSLSVTMRSGVPVNRTALTASLNEIVQRHDVLRSRFMARDGRPLRLCSDAMEIALTELDLRGVSNAERPCIVRRMLARHAQSPFDLARGPLLRAALAALSDEEHVLAITVHHIVFDRWSRRVLVRELTELYEAHVTGRTPVLASLPDRYGDYVRWQRDNLDGPLGRALSEYWIPRLQAVPELSLPRDCVGAHAPSTQAGACSFTIATEDVTRLVRLSRASRTTVGAAMLAVLTLFLHKLCAVDDISVGVPISDRRRQEFEPLIGLFMNVLVVRTMIAPDMTFLDLLDRVRGVLVDSCRHQDMPYGYLVRALGAQRPLYRVTFNFMPAMPPSAKASSVLEETDLAIAAKPQSLADLSFNIRHRADGLACRLIYKADLFSTTRARQFAAQLHTLLTAVLDEPQKRVARYDLLAGEHDWRHVEMADEPCEA
jgi:hypothetical protein